MQEINDSNHNMCCICYDYNITNNIHYECSNECFFNDKTNCIMCSRCIIEWTKRNKKKENDNLKYKCPICRNWSLKLVKDIEIVDELDPIIKQDIEQNNQYCSCNINCNFRIFLEKLSRFIDKYNIYIRIILYLLLLIIIGFIISSLWMIIFEYDIDTFKEEVIHKKWTDPIYYIIICPLAAAIFIIISLLCIGCIKCLDNIC